MIKRERYLKKIRPFYNQDLIKVLIGVRRSGKSVILTQIMEELKEDNILANHIIYMNFEDYDYEEYTNPKKLNQYIKEQIIDNEMYFLFFDEIQNVTEWEKVINSFRATKNVSIFITGSNSDLLSSELATHIAGRYVSFKITPFVFSEICELKKIIDKKDIEDEFYQFLKWGGMPQLFMQNDDFSKKTYLTDIYNSIVMKDIVKRFNVKDVDLLNRVINYILTTPAQIFSATSLADFFKSENRKVSLETIYNYLDYIEKAQLINKAERHLISGKRLLTGKYKYYLTDLGFMNILSEGKKEQKGTYLENIVYNELISRGYNVCYGVSDNSEIDFIATRFDEKIYIQVCYLLGENATTTKREFGAFNDIVDNYPKYVLSLDKIDYSSNGIIHKNVIEWLLNINE